MISAQVKCNSVRGDKVNGKHVEFATFEVKGDALTAIVQLKITEEKAQGVFIPGEFYNIDITSAE